MGSAFSTFNRPVEEENPVAKRRRLFNTVGRRVYIMRGPPGVGKSTWARRQLGNVLNVSTEDLEGVSRGLRLGHIFSTDDFFVTYDMDGQEFFDFDRNQLTHNHRRNVQRLDQAMALSLSPLFVDNTNMALWEMKNYVEIADRSGYEIVIVNPWELHERWNDVEFLEERNAARKKKVPTGVLQMMIGKFENGDVEMIRRSQNEQVRRRDVPLFIAVRFDEACSRPIEDVCFRELPGLMNHKEWPRMENMWAHLERSGLRYANDWHCTLKFYGNQGKKPLSAEEDDFLNIAKGARGDWIEMVVSHLIWVEDMYLIARVRPTRALPVDVPTDHLHVTLMMKSQCAPKHVLDVVASMIAAFPSRGAASPEHAAQSPESLTISSPESSSPVGTPSSLSSSSPNPSGSTTPLNSASESTADSRIMSFSVNLPGGTVPAKAVRIPGLVIVRGKLDFY